MQQLRENVTIASVLVYTNYVCNSAAFDKKKWKGNFGVIIGGALKCLTFEEKL